MCGIIGVLGTQNVITCLTEGLKRLEYRGYDSSGIATLVDGRIARRRAEGKITHLEAVLRKSPLEGHVGIGHTRWATHGVPSEKNAHPHATDKVAIVHNGIIENYQLLRNKLEPDCVYASDTDTEVLVHLITRFLSEGLSPEEAVGQMLPLLEGAFAFVAIFSGHDNLMIGARRGSPLAIGYGEGEMFIGSDALALAPLTQRLCYLEEGDWAVIRRCDTTLYDEQNNIVQRPVVHSAISGAMIGKGNYRHFMEKEIYEQPAVVGDTLHTMLNLQDKTITLPQLPFDFQKLTKLTISACGTACYAAMVAKYWIESLAGLPTEVDTGSEFRYRDVPLPKDGLMLLISQSGETMDTLEALRYARQKEQAILSVVNVAESSMARESDGVILTQAGPEIGVASTKAFTTQLAVLACFAVALGRVRGHLSRDMEASLADSLAENPGKISEILNSDDHLQGIARDIMEAPDIFYLGRGNSYPIALEGAPKLKELSYIHAEGYAAGEMKHGPIALIERGVPVVVLAPNGPLFDKIASNVQEVISRGGKVIFISDKGGIARMRKMTTPAFVIEMPEVNPVLAPILYTIPIQLLAYHIAVFKGTDVDQPRNLAKSVTVE